MFFVLKYSPLSYNYQCEKSVSRCFFVCLFTCLFVFVRLFFKHCLSTGRHQWGLPGVLFSSSWITPAHWTSLCRRHAPLDHVYGYLLDPPQYLHHSCSVDLVKGCDTPVELNEGRVEGNIPPSPLMLLVTLHLIQAWPSRLQVCTAGSCQVFHQVFHHYLQVLLHRAVLKKFSQSVHISGIVLTQMEHLALYLIEPDSVHQGLRFKHVQVPLNSICLLLYQLYNTADVFKKLVDSALNPTMLLICLCYW